MTDSAITYCDPVACVTAGCTPTVCTGAGVPSNHVLFERSRRAGGNRLIFQKSPQVRRERGVGGGRARRGHERRDEVAPGRAREGALGGALVIASLLGILVLREPFTLRYALGMALAIAGIYLIILSSVTRVNK